MNKRLKKTSIVTDIDWTAPTVYYVAAALRGPDGSAGEFEMRSALKALFTARIRYEVDWHALPPFIRPPGNTRPRHIKMIVQAFVAGELEQKYYHYLGHVRLGATALGLSRLSQLASELMGHVPSHKITAKYIKNVAEE